MKYPKFLPEHGVIGFAAPSCGCAIEPYRTAFDHARERFAGLGHSLDLGPNCYAGRGIGISNTPKACGDELTEYYCSVDNDILISCGGGELMCETMEYVDFEKIKKAEPKWFMGYSDNTNMTFLLAAICDTASVYGPCAASFGMEPWHPSLMDAYQILRGQKNEVRGYDLWEKESLKNEENPLAPYHLTEKRNLRIFPGKNENEAYYGMENPNLNVHFEGRLLGGCMDCLVNLLGTKFDYAAEFQEKYKEDGILWFLESCDLNVMAIRRAVWQMKNAGWFQYVKGFLIGRPLCFGQEMMGLDQYDAVVGLLKEYKAPVIMDIDLGHLSPMMPIVCGSYGKVDVCGNDIVIRYEYR